jgi:hypothetical protein
MKLAVTGKSPIYGDGKLPKANTAGNKNTQLNGTNTTVE